MSEGIDFSFARPGGAAIKAAGKQFVVRYLSSNSKGLTNSEINDYKSNNLAIALIYEENGKELLGGFAAGVRVAQEADNHRAKLGLPNTVAIYFAVDFDAAGSDLTACASAIDGAVSVLGYNRVGGYGGINFINAIAGRCKYGWQTYAWSRGQVSNNANLYQYLNGQTINGGGVDFCRNLKADFGTINNINLPNSNPASGGGSLLGVNRSGHSNSEIQIQLNKFGYNLVVDGLIGPNTTGAIVNFQSKHKLATDGIVGPLTWGKLTQATYSVSDYQTLLNNFGYNLVVDNIKGPLTTNAIDQFQTDHGLTIDGIVGPITWAALNVAPPVVVPPVVAPPVVAPPVVAPPVVAPPVVAPPVVAPPVVAPPVVAQPVVVPPVVAPPVVAPPVVAPPVVAPPVVAPPVVAPPVVTPPVIAPPIVIPPKEIILTSPSQTNIAFGTIVTSNTARKIIYGVYAGIAVAAGGAVAYYFGISQPLPTVIVGVQAVIAYLAIPIGGLALANTPSKN
jgi:peptidoglycan hydrolase-like protein with peptidoglycan-binding domain